MRAQRLFLLVCFVIMMAWGGAARAEDFYENQLQLGKVAFTSAELSTSIDHFRIAASGFLDRPKLLTEAVMRLAVAQNDARLAADCAATVDRFLRIEAVYAAYQSADVEAPVRMKFDAVLRAHASAERLRGYSTLAAIAAPPEEEKRSRRKRRASELQEVKANEIDDDVAASRVRPDAIRPPDPEPKPAESAARPPKPAVAIKKVTGETAPPAAPKRPEQPVQKVVPPAASEDRAAAPASRPPVDQSRLIGEATKILAGDPTNIEARLQRGRAFFANGDCTAASSDYAFVPPSVRAQEGATGDLFVCSVQQRQWSFARQLVDLLTAGDRSRSDVIRARESLIAEVESKRGKAAADEIRRRN